VILSLFVRSGADASELLNNIAQHVVAMDPTASTPAATVQALLETPYLFDSSMTIQQLMEVGFVCLWYVWNAITRCDVEVSTSWHEH
jgi:translation elongation factor EF-Ts